MKISMIICGILGHSEFITSFFGYIYCARCGNQLGDNLGGVGYNGLSIDKYHKKNCKQCNLIRKSWGLKQKIISFIEEPILRAIENKD